MEISRNEFKQLLRKFKIASNRILNAKFEIYPKELQKLIDFLDSNVLILNYIKSCGEPEFDVEQEVKEVTNSYGRCIFELGSDEKKEVANIYAVVKYLAENNYDGRSYVYYNYSFSNKYQDKVNGFGNDYIQVMLNHIDSYLYGIGLEIGANDDGKHEFNITNSSFSNTQVTMATDHSTVTISQNNLDFKELDNLLNQLRKLSDDLSIEDQDTVSDCIETIEEVKVPNHKQGAIKIALKTLQGISGTANFVAAVATIVPFVQSIM